MLLLQTTHGQRVKLGYNIKFINISSHLIGVKIHLFSTSVQKLQSWAITLLIKYTYSRFCSKNLVHFQVKIMVAPEPMH